MLKSLPLLFASGLALQTAATAAVTYDFASSIAPFQAGPDGTTAWSSQSGGSMAVGFASGWKAQVVKLDLSSDPQLWQEYQNCLALGGKLTFKMIVVSTDITGSAPGWFESIMVGNTEGVWDQQFGGGDGLIGLYGSGAFPAGATQEINVSYDIDAGTAVRDRALQFSLNSGWNEIFLGMNSGGGGYSAGIYYIDDFKLEANLAPPVVVIPKVDIEPAKQGLHLICADAGQYSRQCIRTTNPDFTWVDRNGAVTYTINVKECPKVDGQNIVIYLTPGDGASSSPDWTYAQCLRLAIYSAANGSGQGVLAYKDGPAESNGPVGHEYWMPDDGMGSGGQLASIDSTKIVGDWSIRIEGNTNITITSPTGTTAAATILASTATKYALATHVYFGTLPATVSNIGNEIVLGGVVIDGTPLAFNESFSTVAWADKFSVSAAVPNAVIPVTTKAYKIKWSLPASGFVLQRSSNLGNSLPWANAGVPFFDVASQSTRSSIYEPAAGADAKKMYFQLKKP